MAKDSPAGEWSWQSWIGCQFGVRTLAEELGFFASWSRTCRDRREWCLVEIEIGSVGHHGGAGGWRASSLALGGPMGFSLLTHIMAAKQGQDSGQRK